MNTAGIGQWREPKNIFIALGILVIGAIVIISILRQSIVDDVQNQVTITGQGKVAYRPDVANLTLGVQIDRAATGEEALNRLNGKVTAIIAAMELLGISEQDIQNQAYTLYPQYDYKDNVSTLAGYSANQKVVIKITNLENDKEILSKVISAASAAGTNQVEGVVFTVSNLNELKQQARIEAIKDAKSKRAGLAEASDISLGKTVSWVENIVQAPDTPQSNLGYGGNDTMSLQKASAQIPTGTQEIIIEVGLIYEVN